MDITTKLCEKWEKTYPEEEWQIKDSCKSVDNV